MKFLGGKVTLFGGDSREVLKQIPDNSIDSICTDPPYALVSIIKRFGTASLDGTTKVEQRARDRVDGMARMSRGFMGKTWDTGEVAFDPAFWAECLRVLKPGGHLLSCGGTRTYHRMACAIEDAGFDIRDMMQWLYGSGFPKSHDVSKNIDKAAGATREVVGFGNRHGGGKDIKGGKLHAASYAEQDMHGPGVLTTPTTDEAKQWEGWGTALKPANEPIVLARKPLSEKTVAANVLKWGTGAINIDGCRVELSGGDDPRLGGNGDWGTDKAAKNVYEGGYAGDRIASSPLGRFPANVIHDGSDEVIAAFPDSGPGPGNKHSAKENGGGVFGGGRMGVENIYKDEGSAARYFYTAKANKKDRAGSKHPTVKPIKLLRYLIRLITPPGGTVLDPFAGSGTTGEAAYIEGFRAILIEREEEYQQDIANRLRGLDNVIDRSIEADPADAEIQQ